MTEPTLNPLPSAAVQAAFRPTGELPRSLAIQVFLAFALAYFFSALVRSITATLAPSLSAEFALSAGDLGLLAGGYFLGFALMQLPLGQWLDRHGPKKVIMCFLGVAVMGCLAFSMAMDFRWLLLARVLCGAGVSACLMAPMTAYRRWFAPQMQQRANSWMLMTGSLGMVASTLPVQWLLPQYGWRPLFVALALLIGLTIGVLALRLPTWQQAVTTAGSGVEDDAVYRKIWAHPYFRRHLWMGFFSYGGLLAVQTLWAGPWLVQVSGYSPVEAATGLFLINLAMLCTFWFWGAISPWLAQRGLGADRLIAWGLPLSLVLTVLICVAGSAVQWWLLALFCMGSSFMSLAQPAVGLAFPEHIAGRALSAYNLVIFSGIFVVQWGIGLLIDGFKAVGLGTTAAFQGAFSVFFICSLAGYLRFVLDNRSIPTSTAVL